MFPNTTRVLLVDDLSSIREVVKAYLHRLGFKHVDEAENGHKGFQTFLEAKVGTPYGLVITDWNMPEMTGIQLIAKIRATTGPESKTPILMMTTESEKDKVFEAIKAGVNNYIVKPVQEDILKEKLESIWKKHTQSAA